MTITLAAHTTSGASLAHRPAAALDVLMVPVGSHGDVHPFVGIGARLRERGHHVTVATNAHFADLVRRVGLDFVECGSEQEFRETIKDPDLWHPRKAFATVMAKGVVPWLRPMYEMVRARTANGRDTAGRRTVVVAHALAFGARLAHDKLGGSFPMATVHLQPSVFRTVYQTPVFEGLWMPQRMPRWMKTAIWKLADAMLVKRVAEGPINQVRREIGLAPVHDVLGAWWNSPQLVIGMFPEWFGPIQPDWPKQLRLAGFPLWDERGVEPLDDALARFLAAGSKPIAFTPGSAMVHGREFFADGAEACRRLGRRGILLTRHREQVPTELPEGVIHVSYVPFSQLLPHCAALVHHGGIGTTAQALAAGVPQVIMPMAHDQPDNAARVGRLGVGQTVREKDYNADTASAALGELLGSPDVVARAKSVAGRFVGVDGIGRACELIEGMAR